MDSRTEWVLSQKKFVVNAFIEAFDYENEVSLVSDVRALVNRTRISQDRRRAILQCLEEWAAVDQESFWHQQRETIAAKRALMSTTTSLLTAANTMPENPSLPPISTNSPASTSTSTVAPSVGSWLQDISTSDEQVDGSIDSPNKPEGSSDSSTSTHSAEVHAEAIEEVVPASNADEIPEQEREELLQSVDDSTHPTCTWQLNGSCIACEFEGYQKICIHALTAKMIKRTEAADLMAVIGVFAPEMPTRRMLEIFTAKQLKEVAGPPTELPLADLDDAKIMQVVRSYLNNKGEDADTQMGAKKKVRIMLETLLEYLPLRTDYDVSESTFVVKYIGPIIQAYIDGGDMTSDFPNTDSTTQKAQAMKAHRPDNQGVYYKLSLKTRGVMMMKEVGTFVVPTRKQMVPALVGTLPTLQLLKDDVDKLAAATKGDRLKRSWSHGDDKVHKKRLL
ncbi:hypothetical protein BGZ94_003939 [Podila epigama]|nr:hypothetical protein BGZ94_003939 [Podila epigama]